MQAGAHSALHRDQLSGTCSGNCKADAVCAGARRYEQTSACDAECHRHLLGRCTGTCDRRSARGCAMANAMAWPPRRAAWPTARVPARASARPAATAMCSGKCEASCKGNARATASVDAKCMVNAAPTSCARAAATACTPAQVRSPRAAPAPRLHGRRLLPGQLHGQRERQRRRAPSRTQRWSFAGDLELQAALEAHFSRSGREAVNLIIALKDPVATFAGQTSHALRRLVTSASRRQRARLHQAQRRRAAKLRAHVNVSVKASASLSGKARRCSTS